MKLKYYAWLTSFLLFLVCLSLFTRRSLLNLTNYFEHVSRFSALPMDNQFECLDGRQKIMFSKNVKVAGSTINSIITKISMLYHKYEYVRPDEIKGERKRHGYFSEHYSLTSVDQFKRIFPKDQFIWLSSVRNPRDQLFSLIKFKNLITHYIPENFDRTYEGFLSAAKANPEKVNFRFHSFI